MISYEIMYTIPEAANALRISEERIHDFISRGILKIVLLNENVDEMLITGNDLEEFVGSLKRV